MYGMFFFVLQFIATHFGGGITGASPGFRRGGQEFSFQIWEFACHEAMRIARGVRVHAPPPEKFF